MGVEEVKKVLSFQMALCSMKLGPEDVSLLERCPHSLRFIRNRAGV
jgi:hypothetical protein